MKRRVTARNRAIQLAVGPFLIAVGSLGQAGVAPAHAQNAGAEPWWVPTQLAETVSPRALAQLDTAWRVIQRLPTRRAARSERYRRIFPLRQSDLNALAGEHWLNRELLVGPLDFARPAYLMFYPLDGPDDWSLVGVAYGIEQPAGAAPPDGFDRDHDAWHFHLYCEALPDQGPALAHDVADCRALGGAPAGTQIAMVHVWAVPNPDGIFVQENPALPYVAAGLAVPPHDQFHDAKHGPWLRTLALAVGETFDALPRLGGLVDRGPGSPFGRRAAPHREQLRLLLPALRAAERAGDRDRYRAVGDSMILEWGNLREIYLELANPTLRVLIGRWIDRVTRVPGGHQH